MLIGTHNSTAYQLNLDIPLWPKWSRWNLLRIVAKMFPCVKQTLVQNTLCQSLSVYQQLSSNVEVLDIRVAWYKQFWCAHTFATITLDELLKQVEQYCTEHPFRHITLLVRHDWEAQASMRGKEDELLQKLGRISFRYLNLTVFYEKSQIFPTVHPVDQLRFVWFNVDDTATFSSALSKYTFHCEDDILCFILTPQITKFEDLKRLTSIRALAYQLNPLFKYWKERMKHEYQPRVVLFDYVEDIF